MQGNPTQNYLAYFSEKGLFVYTQSIVDAVYSLKVFDASFI